jgi:hypothetical protein
MVAAGLAPTRNARAGGAGGGLVPAAACGSQNPPRCRVSGTAGIPVIHGRQDVKGSQTPAQQDSNTINIKEGPAPTGADPSLMFSRQAFLLTAVFVT